MKIATLCLLAAIPAAAGDMAMTPAQLRTIQAALAKPNAAPMLSVPALSAIADLNPKLASHVEAVGALDLPKGAAPSEILQGYYNPANLARIQSVIERRTSELGDAKGAKPAAELSALADLGSGVKSPGMVKAVAAARKLAASLDPSAAKVDEKDIEWVPILSLRPMQFGVGMTHQVAKKRDALLKMSPSERRAFLVAHAIPVVEHKGGHRHINKGPMSRKEERPDDHHHELRAAWEAGVTEVPIKKVEEDRGHKKFWKKMKKDKLVYLYDEFGSGPHDPADLPLDVRGLADDPYRDLAGWIRDLGAYKKNHVPFSEFLWAKFLRENLTIHPHEDWDGSVKEAMELARSKAAKKLPGWIGKKK